jgi:hypothetical protein
LKVVNIWGGPGVGKSTAAAGLLYEMKKKGLNVEIAMEYAKDAVWEKRYNILDDQIYIFAKQHRRISRLKDSGIEWVITDSPIPLGLVYLRPNVLSENFNRLVMEVFDQYTNHNFLLRRNFNYNPIGRNQKDEEEAKEFDRRVELLIDTFGVKFDTIPSGEMAVDAIMQKVVMSNIQQEQQGIK